jgi:hypothetical protein
VENSKIRLGRSFRQQAQTAASRTALYLLLAACSSDTGGLASRRNRAPAENGGATGLIEEPIDPGASGGEQVVPTDPNAVFGIEPGHGPFRGGQLAVIRGNGFSSQVRVWFGNIEVPADQLTATRADRVQVAVPAGVPGSVPVATQNGDDVSTRRVLDAAYVYDTFYAEPEIGATSGGELITLFGSGTTWDATTSVSIDQVACELVEVRGAPGGPQELDCRAPAGTEGSKSISVATAGVVDSVLGGFSYEPGAAVAGGLSGAPLAERLSVYVSGPGGAPVPEAYVVLGSDIEAGDLDPAALEEPGANVRRTSETGEVVFERNFDAPALVTIAARCFQPKSFVDVPVDTLRAELTPVASPDCGEAQTGSFGGAPTSPVFLRGELVWRGGVEFQRSGWPNVPAEQSAQERRAAYIFQPSSDPEATFRLPRAEEAITLDSPGNQGYQFQLVTGGGSRTLYALAGVENREVSPPRFTAYAMGLLRGVFANSGDTLEGLAIRMDRTIDQALSLDVTGPVPGAEGPDRVAVRAAVQIAGSGYAILPNAELQTAVAGGNGLSIIGLPALTGDLEGSRYVVGARAFTGIGRTAPTSVLPLITAPEASRPISVSGFLPVPTLRVGAEGALAWDGELAVTFDDPSGAVSVVRYDIQSGGGLITWSVAAPPAAASFRLPDLSRLPEGDMISGTLDVSVTLANVEELDYTTLGEDQLQRGAWEAYATDLARARYQPAPSPPAPAP